MIFNLFDLMTNIYFMILLTTINVANTSLTQRKLICNQISDICNELEYVFLLVQLELGNFNLSSLCYKVIHYVT